MLIPVLIFVGCMTAGVFVAARWLPDLAAGSVGGLAFFTVCGLLGAAAGMLGLHIYSIIEALGRFTSRGGGLFGGEGAILAGQLQSLVFDVGSLLALAGIVYLLAPAPEFDDAELVPEPAA